MTAYEGKELLTRNVCDWGNGYAEIVRDAQQGRVKALWPLAPDRMKVDRDELNRRRYRYRAQAGKGSSGSGIPRNRPSSICAPTPSTALPVDPRSRILADCYGLTKAAEEFGARFFSNNAMPSAVATYKKTLTPAQKNNLRESWQRVHGGLANAHRLAILENDIQLTKMGVDPAAAQFMELRMLQIEEIARVLRVPLFMIQHMTKSTAWGSGIESMMLAFINITMMPWFTIWQQTIGRDLLTQKSFATHTALFVTRALQRGDFKSMQEGLEIKFRNGAVTRNEWRELEDQNGQDDEFADEPMVPINNMVPASLARETFKKQQQAQPAPAADPAAAPAAGDGE
jgi:HK97 family phage portal protein